MTTSHIKWHLHQSGVKDGFPILYLHGFMGSGKVWLPIMENFNEQAFQIAPDLPGHGHTGAALEALDFDSLAEELISLTSEKFSRPPILVGYSMGGRIALYTALKYPAHFSALVLESATAGISSETDRAARLQLDQARAAQLRQVDMPTFLTEWYRQPIYASLAHRPELIEQIIHKKSDGNRDHLAEAVVRLSPGLQSPLWDRLATWSKPTLIIAGQLDDKYLELAFRMSQRLNNSLLTIVPRAGHIVHLENRPDFIGTLKSFLDSCIL